MPTVAPPALPLKTIWRLSMRASEPKPIGDHQQPGTAILAQLQERRVVEADGGRGASRQGGATTHTHAVAAILGA